MDTKFIFVTGGVVSGLGKGDYGRFSRPSFKSSWPKGHCYEAGSLPKR